MHKSWVYFREPAQQNSFGIFSNHQFDGEIIFEGNGAAPLTSVLVSDAAIQTMRLQ